MPPTTGMQKRYIHLKSLKILSRPTRNPCFSTSLAVAIHSILIEKKWHSRAVERWREIPPKKRTNIGVHFIVSTTDQKNTFCPSLCRSIAKARGDYCPVRICGEKCVSDETYQDVKYDRHADEDLPTSEVELINIG